MRLTKSSPTTDTTTAFALDLGTFEGGAVPFLPRGNTADSYASPDGGGDGWPGGRIPEGETWGDGRDDRIDQSGSSDDAVIYTFAGDDVIFLGTGDNTVFAGLGDDEVYGNSGNDLIVGGGGDDTVFGGDGQDEIHAGSGADFVSGGGDDDFIFLTDDDQVDTVAFGLNGGYDVVDGFETGVDRVDATQFDTGFDAISIAYNADGTQALVTFDVDSSILFTGLDGMLSESDFMF